jgi:exportin-5
MNGSANGHSTVSEQRGLDGPSEHVNGGNTTLLPRIHEALEIVHGPYSSNQSRRQASLFLEEIKTDDEAPFHGYTLASDKNQQPVVRHYALSLLEHAIKHRWAAYSEEQATLLRSWVLQLSEHISREDPLYLRNKTAQLWVEIAKRSWAAEWVDMDELLVQLWNITGSVVHKEFVLFVLETLSDEIFNGEDTVAILREGALSRACVDIFTPAIVLAERFPNRQGGPSVRYSEEGWLVRLGELLNQCLDNGLQANTQYQNLAAKTLTVYKSAMPWVIPQAISSASCVQHMCKSLAASSVAVQLVSIVYFYSILTARLTSPGICGSTPRFIQPYALRR